MAKENISALSDRDLRRDALNLSLRLLPEGKKSDGGLYRSTIQKTAKELIDDAEVVFKYLKEGTG